MAAVGYALLALVTLASAVAVVGVRQRPMAGLALGLNLLCLAAIAWTLSAPLVALLLAWVGVGVMLATLATCGHPRQETTQKNGAPASCWPVAEEEPSSTSGLPGWRRARLAWALFVGIFLLISLGSVLWVNYAPGQVGASREVAVGTQDPFSALVAVLYMRYGLGVLAVALMALVAVVGARLRRRGE